MIKLQLRAVSIEAALGSGGAVSVRYEVTIMGEPGHVLRGVFSDVTVRRASGVTVLSADLDQAGLHGLLARVADLGIELVGVRRAAASTRPGGRAP